jgi:hypothetical protein
LQYFPEFLLKVGFLQKKRDTRAILLKIALVRISCIQNTQIRGETIAKVFGKVDTFWTYQSHPVLFPRCCAQISFGCRRRLPSPISALALPLAALALPPAAVTGHLHRQLL